MIEHEYEWNLRMKKGSRPFGMDFGMSDTHLFLIAKVLFVMNSA